MKTIMIKSLITLIASLFLTACGKKGITAQGDSDLLFEVHKSVLPQQPNWKEPELKQRIYFGKYLHSSDRVQKYFGDSLGPIVAIWKVGDINANELNLAKMIQHQMSAVLNPMEEAVKTYRKSFNYFKARCGPA